MRFIVAFVVVLCAAAQPAAFTLDQVLGEPFPTQLTAAPRDGKIAWISNARGIRNILVAEPPRYQPRKITSYTADDGQELSDLQWTPDAAAMVYVRGGDSNSAGESPNSSFDVRGAEQAIWVVRLDGGPPRRLGDGNRPAVSPKGDQVAYNRRGKIWIAPLDGHQAAAQAFQARGVCGRPVWSPD